MNDIKYQVRADAVSEEFDSPELAKQWIDDNLSVNDKYEVLVIFPKEKEEQKLDHFNVNMCLTIEALSLDEAVQSVFTWMHETHSDDLPKGLINYDIEE